MNEILHIRNENYELVMALGEDDRLAVSVMVDGSGPSIVIDAAHIRLLKIAVGGLLDDDMLPKFEPATCATRHLLAERAVRIIEGFARNGGRLDTETLSSIEQLVDDAGVNMAREALSPDVPF